MWNISTRKLFKSTFLLLFVSTAFFLVVWKNQSTNRKYFKRSIKTDCPISQSAPFRLRHVEHPHPAFEVIHAGAPILDRIQSFIKALSILRCKISKSIGGVKQPWCFDRSSFGTCLGNVSSTTTRTVIFGKDDDFNQRLSNFSQVTTLILPWDNSIKPTANQRLPNTLGKPSSDVPNLLVQNYYAWSYDEPLCTWLTEIPSHNSNPYDVLFKYECRRNETDTVSPIALPRVFLNVVAANRVRHYWYVEVSDPASSTNNEVKQNTFQTVRRTTDDDFYQSSPPTALYCHVIRDAVVTSLGDVFTNDMKFVPDACSRDGDPNLPADFLQRPVYDELLVISQHWGSATFHRMVEVVPRIAVYIDFLIQYSNVKIHAPEGDGGRLAEVLRILGLDPKDRLVTGLTRAKIVYLPRSSCCGTINVLEGQILSRQFRLFTTNYLLGSNITFVKPMLRTVSQSSNLVGLESLYPRDKLILIKRTGSRHLTKQTEIEAVLSRAAVDFGLVYVLFDDQHLPSFHQTMILFHSAVLVVAPHGAGLSNVLFSQPGTFVIEAVCNPPHVNVCFHRLAVVLGHHWHGIPSRGGCESSIDVAPENIDVAVRKYLSSWKKLRSS